MTPSRTSDSAPRPAAILLIVLGLIALTALVYRGVHRFEFVNFDDDVHVYANPFVNSGLTWQNIVWAFEIHGPSQWHPLAWISHQLDSELFGPWPGGHHLTSLVLHIANVVLLFAWLAGLTHAVWRSAFVAAAFAVHPLNVESVAWVSERRNVLCLFFCLLTLILYVQYGRRGRILRYLGVLILFALALMSKPLAVTLPCVMLLLDYWPLKRCTRSSPQSDDTTSEQPGSAGGTRPAVHIGFLILEKVPLLLLAAGASVLTILCQRGVVVSGEVLPLKVRVLNAIAAYGLYLKKIVWPADLGVFYPHPAFFSDDPLSELLRPAIAGTTVVTAVSAAAVWLLRNRPALAVGWFWFLGTLVPMIGLVQVGRQQLADRYVYLPLIGLLIALAWTVPKPGRAKGRRFLAALALASVGLLAFTARGQVITWRNSVSLYEQALRVTDENSWAHNNLGIALHQLRDPLGALTHLGQAVEIDPDYGLARYNLGVVLHDLGKTQMAIAQFEEAVKLMPDDLDSRLRLGIAQADMGETDLARAHFEHAVQVAPDSPDAHFNLGLILSRQQLPRLAIEHYRSALEHQPAHHKARYALAEALLEVGDLQESEQQFRILAEAAPFAARAHQGLGKILLERGERARGLERLREALRLDPTLREARNILQREAGE